MMNVDNMETLDNTNDLFDYFADMDLNSDIKDIYDVINDEQFVGEFEKEKHLSELRNENHKRYYAINTKRIENLPDEFSEIVYDILKLYNFIDSKILLTEDISAAENSKMLLDNIYRKLGRTDKMVETTLKEIVAENDKNQSKFSTSYFKNLDIDIKTKESLLNKYNDLVLFNTLVIDDNYENLKTSVPRETLEETLHILDAKESICRRLHPWQYWLDLNSLLTPLSHKNYRKYNIYRLLDISMSSKSIQSEDIYIVSLA